MHEARDGQVLLRWLQILSERENVDAAFGEILHRPQELVALLRQLPSCLRPGGRVAVLSFHSGEDRRVKKALQLGERGGIYATIAREVIRASAAEQRANPRSAPAKLRYAVRAG